MSLKWPLVLVILLLPVIILVWRRFKKPRIKPIFVAESAGIKNLPSFKKIAKKAKYYRYLESSFLCLLIISVALLASRPVAPTTSYSIEKSRDIVILLDVSGSMKQYIPPMLDVMEDIIKQNPSERYSIVTFAAVSNTVLPLTRDPVAIKDSIDLLRRVYKDNDDPNYSFRGLNGGGTDIGEGVLGAVTRFDDLETKKSRNVILLSDLDQTGGDLDPNSEFYLDKVSLLPKHNINFFILQTPSESGYMASLEVADYGGATLYEVDGKNSDSSVRDLSRKIFGQVLNNQLSVGKNLTDSPNLLILSIILLAISLMSLRFLRWKKL